MTASARLVQATGIGCCLGLAAGWYVSGMLTARRTPDPVRHPDRLGLEHEIVHFTARDGIPLTGWWLPATAAQGVSPRTVVFAHGQSGSMDGDLHLAPPLVAQGFNVLMFDFRAHGRSGGERVTFGYGEVLDLRGALDWLQQAHGVTRAGVLGFSMGAGVALTTAAHDRRIAAIVADCPFGRLHPIVTAALRDRGLPAPVAGPLSALALRLASLAGGTALEVAEPLRWIHRVSTPVLLIGAEQDRFVPSADTQALFEALPDASQLWVVPDADHREAYSVQPETYVERVLAWFQNHGV